MTLNSYVTFIYYLKGRAYRMNKTIWMIAVLAFTVSSVLADEVTDALSKASSEYEAKNYSEASKAINAALKGIEKIISDQVIQCLPGNMEGWEKAEPSTNLGSEGAFGLASPNTYSVEANYMKKEPSQQVSITISNIPHIVQIAKAGIQLLSNPFFAKMQQENQPEEKVETYKVGDFEGAKSANLKQKRAEISLFYGDLLVQVKGNGIEDAQILEPFVQGINYEALKKYASNTEANSAEAVMPTPQETVPAEQTETQAVQE
jgi:hypothetical protein